VTSFIHRNAEKSFPKNGGEKRKKGLRGKGIPKSKDVKVCGEGKDSEGSEKKGISLRKEKKKGLSLVG